MFRSADRVKETSIGTGTGALTLAGAMFGYRTFSSVLAQGDTCYYVIQHTTLNEWEVGVGTFSPGSLARTTVLSSTNQNSLVNFSVGTKEIFITASAEKFLQIDPGLSHYGNFTAGTITASLAGTATSATELATPRTINGTSFNGSANITTANWGTSRNITIGSSTKAVDGSGNVSWQLADIGAQAVDADLDAIAALVGTSGLLRKTAANTWQLDTNQYITGNQSITFTGDATGSGSTTVTLILANSGVTAGTYNNSQTQITPYTVDAKGRITATGSTVTITPDWSNIVNKPDPVITVTLTGDVTGSGNTTLTDLASGTISFATTIAANSVALGTDTTGNYVASVATTAPLSGGASGTEGSTLTLSLATGYGDTQNPYAQKTSNTFLAAPNGSTGAPSFRAIVAADIPTLNQNTTGSAATLTTARSIWGQSFNGSANISGALQSVQTIQMSGQLTSTVTSGTAPFIVASTTQVTNLNSDMLDGQHGGYYLDQNNHTNKPAMWARQFTFMGA